MDETAYPSQFLRRAFSSKIPYNSQDPVKMMVSWQGSAELGNLWFDLVIGTSSITSHSAVVPDKEYYK